jgi:uncharacterized protein YggE
MQQRSAAALALAILASIGLQAGEPELKGTATELRQFLHTGNREVVLSGYAKQKVQADVGHVTVIVHTQAKDLTQAIAANAQRREAMAQAIQSQGIESKAIHAQKFASSPQFGWFGKTPASFEVTNRLTVDVTDERQLMIVTAAGTNPPDVTIGEIKFEYSRQRELEEQARRAAFDDALAKKTFFEQRLGATLRPVGFKFSDYSAQGTPGGALEEIIVTAQKRAPSMRVSDENYAPVASFDEREYEVSVSVTFAVEPVATVH